MSEIVSNFEDVSRFYPFLSDWIAIQGGKPRVFYNPRKPNTSKWVVLHVYDEHPGIKERFANGAVVDTLPPDPNNIPLSKLFFTRKITRKTVEGKEIQEEIEREVIVPSMMRSDVHGDPCESRSQSLGGEPYPKIKNQRQYEEKILALAQQGMVELQYGVRNDALTFYPLSQIREPRPLGVGSKFSS